MACAIEDAGFEVRDMIEWCYGSGFPKSLNIGKSVNQLETNEWSKISKALDNIDQKSIMDVWKTNAKLAGIKLVKNLTGVGSNTRRKYFVHDIAVLYFNQEKENASAITAELNLCVPSRTSEENLSIAVGSVEQNTELSQNLVKSVVKLSENQRAKSWNIFTAQCDVKEWLNENTEVSHKVDEALKTLRGNKKYSNEEIINVLCVVIPSVLKHTILNQSKTFQSLDTNQKMECASAINVIITEYTAENLISNTVAILKSKTVDKLQGNEREEIGRNPNSRENCDKSNTLYESGTVGKTDILTKGTSEWEGWGTALKPAHEPICMARKPLADGGLDIAKNICYNIMEKGLITNNKILWRIKLAKNVDKQRMKNYSIQIQQQKTVVVSAEFVEMKENESVGKKIQMLIENICENGGTTIPTKQEQIVQNITEQTKSEYHNTGKHINKRENKMPLMPMGENANVVEKKDLSSLPLTISTEEGCNTEKKKKSITSILGSKSKDTQKDLGCYVGTATAQGVCMDIVRTIKVSFENKEYEFEQLSDGSFIWNENLKPFREPKPLNVAENVLKWGTGGINIDESRVGTEEMKARPSGSTSRAYQSEETTTAGGMGEDKVGRFPANLIWSCNEDEYMLKSDIEVNDFIKLKSWYENKKSSVL